ncbi:muscle M-line assembly protein unc-89 [Drosophila ficusphila]|uniref:muscle M-line assembly protein unc-89 n=1 Tax=Drosophila ficusphila TaxID=30025 RepID=UPI001C8AD302|nr:muscle M-line assembly protein unc-89 [Drosophila ficusphila]
MNGTRKNKSIRTIRLADVLYDEQKRLITLCRSCERHFMTFQSFQNHLIDCSGLKHIVTPADPLTYDDAKRETRLVNGRQELHIYDLEAVKCSSANNSIIDWEAELEDPRWYTDAKPPAQALPKTKSKENVVTEYLVQLTEEPPETEVVPVKRQRTLSSARRPILTAQQQRRSRTSQPSPQPPAVKTKKDTILVPTVLEDLMRLQESPKKEQNTRAAPAAQHASRSPTARKSQIPPSRSPKLPPVADSEKPPRRTSQRSTPPITSQKPTAPATTKVSPAIEKPPMDGTQKILNKLRACGVEVKRGNTRLNGTPPNDQNPTKNQETLDIMRKLQSKGIRCTKVKKQ